MAKFAAMFRENEIVQAVLEQISWYHNNGEEANDMGKEVHFGEGEAPRAGEAGREDVFA